MDENKLSLIDIEEIRRQMEMLERGLMRYEDGSYRQHSTEDGHIAALVGFLQGAALIITLKN